MDPAGYADYDNSGDITKERDAARAEAEAAQANIRLLEDRVKLLQLQVANLEARVRSDTEICSSIDGQLISCSAERDRLQAACAAKDAALVRYATQEVWDGDPPTRTGLYECVMCSCEGGKPESLPHENGCPLSPDAGRDYVPREELEAAKAEVEKWQTRAVLCDLVLEGESKAIIDGMERAHAAREELKAELARVQAERDQFQAEAINGRCTIRDLRGLIEAMEAETDEDKAEAAAIRVLLGDAGRDLLERLKRYEAALKYYADPNHVPDGPTLDVCREYCRLANEALDPANKQAP